MMNVAACASVGRGPSDARPEHYHGGGPDASVGFKDSKDSVSEDGAVRREVDFDDLFGS